MKNGISEILRRVESGESYVVTNQGREVAELRPCLPRRWNTWEQVEGLFRGPPDPTFMADLERLEGGAPANPWDE